LLFCASWLVTGGLSSAENRAPRLAMVISIDQFRVDYLDRFAPYFGEGGFQRLRAGGRDYLECHYRHAVTKTAPGHATILSGVHADVHGIVGNEWVDRSTWEVLESVEDHSVSIIGAAPHAGRSPGGALEAKAGRSPRNFLATTVGDQLKLRFGAQSRVFSVAHKDRSSILMGGKLADSAYWIQDGRFVTSTYYRNQLPSWVEGFNAAGRVEKFFGQTWDRLLAPALYDAVQGPDDAPGENTDFGFGHTLPKQIDGGARELGPKFYEAFETTPAASEIVGEFAELALKEEKLGHHAGPDLLCVGFSQIDKIGHAYGPDSHEIMDSVIRLDRVLARLLDAVDREVGLANCVIVLTADHGSSPLPEHVQALHAGMPAGRLDTAATDQAVNAALEQAFGSAAANDYWALRDNFGYHLRPSVLAAKHIAVADAAAVVKQALLARPEIATAFTAAEVLAMGTEGDALTAQSRRSYFPGRSQDVVFVLKPYFIDRPKTGANHGTPYDYDNHVPLLWFGAGVPAGRRLEPVGVDDLAPTLAALLGVSKPPQARGRRLF
jgi:predicted AlkP superfamily pyrophosphatase or phosphodiesterase